MSTKLKEDVVGLIKSLSKSEKRYFKLFVSKNSTGEGNHYIKLFDLIDKAGSAEKQVIQKLYRNDQFMKKGFSVYKTLLYKQVLKSLKSYHSEGTIDDKIIELIRDSIILFNKALYPDAAKSLEKAKTIALKYEKHTLLLEIVYWQKKNNVWIGQEKPNEQDNIGIYEEEKCLIDKIANANEFWYMSSMMVSSMQIHGIARNHEDILRNKAIISHPIFENEEQALSHYARMAFNFSYHFYYLITNNVKEAYKYSKKALELMEAYPHYIAENPLRYSSILRILISACTELKKYEEAFNLISKLYSLIIKYKLPFFVLMHTHVLNLSTYINTGQFKKANLFLAKIQPLLKEQEYKNEHHNLLFRANLALLHLINKQYHEALMNINFVLNENKDYLRDDHYSVMRIIQLVIHFEKGNTDLLPYLIKSFYKYLIQKKQLHKTENIFIHFLRTRIDKMNTKKDQEEAFKALREELLQIYNDPLEKRFLKFFDILSWLESKIKNRPFEEIIREKSGYISKEEID